MKYTLIAEDEFGGSKTTREFEADYLPDVLTEVELFLKGAGFVFDGNLDFVNDFDTDLEPEWDDCYVDPDFGDHGGGSVMADYPELYDEIDLPKTKSHYYFDTERNK
jgi:hypothetical protein